MLEAKTKVCKRCFKHFYCNPLEVEKCQCFNISLSDVSKKIIADKYEDCLCAQCLREIQSEES